MRVLIVNSHGGDATYGGAERYVAALRTGLEARGHSCRVLSAYPVRGGRNDALATLHATDWREARVRRLVDHLDAWYAAPSAHLRSAIAAATPDLVHTSNLYGITTGVWENARRLGVPVVHTLHDYGLLCPRTTLRRPDGAPCRPHPLACGLRTRRLLRWSSALDGLVGVSAHVLARHAGLVAGRTWTGVIHAPLVAPSDGAPPPPAMSPQTIGYVGRLTSEKGVDDLVVAAPALRRLGVAVRIAGDGPLRERVATAPGVEFAGHLEDHRLAGFVAACDLGVVPSRWEEPGLSHAALEWLGAGRPVLTSGRGGLGELPDAGTRRFDAGVDGLVAGVGELLRPGVWGRLIAAASRLAGRAASGVEEAAWIDAHLAVYERVRR